MRDALSGEVILDTSDTIREDQSGMIALATIAISVSLFTTLSQAEILFPKTYRKFTKRID